MIMLAKKVILDKDNTASSFNDIKIKWQIDIAETALDK